MIIFISCSKLKASKRCKAKEIYQSTLFKKSLSYAESLKPRKIYILSAKYGLLELDDLINPYELTLRNANEQQRKQWADKVYQQMCKRGVDFNEETIFLCGKNYRKYLMRLFINASAPLKDLTIGKQLRFYDQQMKVRKP